MCKQTTDFQNLMSGSILPLTFLNENEKYSELESEKSTVNGELSFLWCYFKDTKTTFLEKKIVRYDRPNISKN